MSLTDFMRESLMIEGIHREPTAAEMQAAEEVMGVAEITIAVLGAFQEVMAPEKPLRTEGGMNVRVGNYVAPPGGAKIAADLAILCECANSGFHHPWNIHVEFERIHPYLDGNGRTGRILWAWQMRRQKLNPFGLSFLHRFYYQTLERSV